MMPSMVSRVRILLAAIASQAMVSASRKPLENWPQPVDTGKASFAAAALD